MQYRFFLIFFLLLSSLHAQQDPLMSLYQENLSYHNPAAIGLPNYFQAGISGRKQWSNASQSPITGMAVLDLYCPPALGGLGAIYFHDRIGYMNTNYFGLGYSYPIPVGGGSSILSLSIRPALYQLSMDSYSKFIFLSPDPSFPTTKTSQAKPDFDAGILFYSSRLNIGASARHLFAPEFKKIHFSLVRHYYFHATYAIINSDVFNLSPSLIVRMNSNTTLIEAMMRSEFLDKKIRLGISYRFGNNTNPLVFFAGLKIIKKLYFNFSYDYPAQHSSFMGPTFEANITYRISNEK